MLCSVIDPCIWRHKTQTAPSPRSMKIYKWLKDALGVCTRARRTAANARVFKTTTFLICVFQMCLNTTLPWGTPKYLTFSLKFILKGKLHFKVSKNIWKNFMFWVSFKFISMHSSLHDLSIYSDVNVNHLKMLSRYTLVVKLLNETLIRHYQYLLQITNNEKV